MTDETPETATVKIVMENFARENFRGELLEYGDEGEVYKTVMRGGVDRGVYDRLDGCQATVEDEGRGRFEHGDDRETRTRPCKNDALEDSEYCGVHQ